jgi:hypothetical protein
MCKNKELSDDEKIAMGICVSPYTVDRCPKCTDTCKASHWKHHVEGCIQDAGIKIIKEK